MSDRTERGDPGGEQNWCTMNHKSVPPAHRKFAKSMRSEMTEAELKLWNAVRASRLMELKFRRQLPIAGYIVDFACPSHRIIVELDGSQQNADGTIRYDNERTRNLQTLGWTVVRFWNDDVLKDINGVCQHIVLVAAQKNGGIERP